MFHTIHTLVLVASFFGLVGQSDAQSRIIQRVVTAQAPAAVYVQAPAPAPAVKPLVTLEGREEWGTTGALTFEMFANGKVVMIDSTLRPVEGTYKVDGNRMLLFFGNCVYDGTEVNGLIVGRARYSNGPDAGRSWNFRVMVRNPLIGRTFSGNETLAGYGAVSFRFVNGNTVEMTDRDGVTRGTYTQNGLQAVMTFGGVVYTGDIRGNSIAGSARNNQSTWTFQVNTPN